MQDVQGSDELAGAPEVVRTRAELREAIGGWRRAGEVIGLVGTMGALHEGHMSLVRLARGRASRVVASIFVNPLQFGEAADLARYPRTVEADLGKLRAAAVDLVYVPPLSEMYPDGGGLEDQVIVVQVHGPLGNELEGAHRPGHFNGVAMVITKLLLQIQPDFAVFGEKDYQQLQVIRRLVRGLDIPVEIVDAPIVREADGLAMSSRNIFLDARQRAVASRLPQVMRQTAAAIGAVPGEVAAILGDGREALLRAGFDGVDYLDLREPGTLLAMVRLDRPGRLLAAARLGSVRLIDNMAVEPPPLPVGPRQA